MRLNYLSNAIGVILADVGYMAFVPLFVAAFYKEWTCALAFLFSGLLSEFLGLKNKAMIMMKTIIPITISQKWDGSPPENNIPIVIISIILYKEEITCILVPFYFIYCITRNNCKTLQPDILKVHQ